MKKRFFEIKVKNFVRRALCARLIKTRRSVLSPSLVVLAVSRRLKSDSVMVSLPASAARAFSNM